MLQAAKRRNFAMVFLSLEVGIQVRIAERQFLLSDEFVEYLMTEEGGNGVIAEALQRLFRGLTLQSSLQWRNFGTLSQRRLHCFNSLVNQLVDK